MGDITLAQSLPRMSTKFVGAIFALLLLFRFSFRPTPRDAPLSVIAEMVAPLDFNRMNQLVSRGRVLVNSATAIICAHSFVVLFPQ